MKKPMDDGGDGEWFNLKTLNFQLDEFQCPVYEDSKRVFQSSREYQTLRTKYEEVLKGAANYTGVEDKEIKLTDLPKLWNHFVVEVCYVFIHQEMLN